MFHFASPLEEIWMKHSEICVAWFEHKLRHHVVTLVRFGVFVYLLEIDEVFFAVFAHVISYNVNRIEHNAFG